MSRRVTFTTRILGTVLGAFIFGAAVTLIKRPSFNATTFILAMLAGAAWVIGQVGQYYSYSKVGVSETMPTFNWFAVDRCATCRCVDL